MSNSKPHMLQPIQQLQGFAKKENLELALKKCFFKLLTVQYLGHEIVFFRIKPFPTKIVALHKIFSPTTKIELMKFIGSTNFYSKVTHKLHVSMNPLYDLRHDIIKFYWNKEL